MKMHAQTQDPETRDSDFNAAKPMLTAAGPGNCRMCGKWYLRVGVCSSKPCAGLMVVSEWKKVEGEEVDAGVVVLVRDLSIVTYCRVGSVDARGSSATVPLLAGLCLSMVTYSRPPPPPCVPTSSTAASASTSPGIVIFFLLK